jgi:SAM-dependent methyltransferase
MISNGLLSYTPGGSDDEHKYYMSKEVSALLKRDGNLFSGFWPLVASTPCLPPTHELIVSKYQQGTGIEWGDLPQPIIEAVSDFFRPVYSHLLPSWIQSLHPALCSRFSSSSLVLDVGCGAGYSSYEMAKQFPSIHVIGVDYHEGSIQQAQKLADSIDRKRLRFMVADSSSAVWHGDGDADIVCFFDCWHDMENPKAAAEQAFSALKPDGIVLIIEPGAAEEIGLDHAVDFPVTPIFSACSSYMCTLTSLGPSGRGAGLGACTPTCVHRDTFTKAGFTSFEVLPGEGLTSPSANGFRFMVVTK